MSSRPPFCSVADARQIHRLFSRLHPSPFYRLAQVVLVAPLSTATKEARSPFLKSESFRLLGVLFGRNMDQTDPSELEKKGHESLESNSVDVLRNINTALQDEDMLKTKRAKDVLKSASKVVAFQKENPDAAVSKELVAMKYLVDKVKDSSESSGVDSACDKLLAEIEDRLKVTKQDSGGTDKASESTSKKKKKKKGKKKR